MCRVHKYFMCFLSSNVRAWAEQIVFVYQKDTLERLDAADRRAASAAGLELGPVSLQQLIVRKTSIPETEFGAQS